MVRNLDYQKNPLDSDPEDCWYWHLSHSEMEKIHITKKCIQSVFLNENLMHLYTNTFCLREITNVFIRKPSGFRRPNKEKYTKLSISNTPQEKYHFTFDVF